MIHNHPDKLALGIWCIHIVLVNTLLLLVVIEIVKIVLIKAVVTVIF